MKWSRELPEHPAWLFGLQDGSGNLTKHPACMSRYPICAMLSKESYFETSCYKIYFLSHRLVVLAAPMEVELLVTAP